MHFLHEPDLDSIQKSQLSDESDRFFIGQDRQAVRKVLSERTSPNTLTLALHNANNASVS
jgi:hypothetical protein